jgi:hypothetical protein
MLWLVERLISLIGPIAALSKDRREQVDAALKAVSAALTETYLYYRVLDAGKRQPDTEAQLARL